MKNIIFILVFISITILGCGMSEKNTALRHCQQDKVFDDWNSKSKSGIPLNQLCEDAYDWCERVRNINPEKFDKRYVKSMLFGSDYKHSCE